VKAIARDGAQVGDGIYLSSLTGWSAAGLELLSSGSKEKSEVALKAVSEFKSPTIDYGFNSTSASALCDISDALVIQATQMADRSKVAFKFDLSKFEVSNEFVELEKLSRELGLDVWNWIFAGGEDHVLLATGQDLPGILIGEVIAGSGIQNIPADLETSAWQHFK
jgi:thiamine-monophosphate kinase